MRPFYQVNKRTLLERIAESFGLERKRHDGTRPQDEIGPVRRACGDRAFRKRGFEVRTEAVLQQLVQADAAVRHTFGINMVALISGQP